MKIQSSFTGLKLKPYQTEINGRHAMNYAAAIGDDNPAYFDDERPGGALAPPMLAVSLTWPISANIWDYLPDPDFPTHLLLTQVHYSEHLQFYRPLRPGMKVKVEGHIAAIAPHRAGTIVTLCYDVSLTNGDALFTEYIGGLLRGVTCDGPAQGLERLPTIPELPLIAERPLWRVSLDIDPLASYLYDGCAELHFPIHTSPRFAKSVGLPGIIYQGTATLAHACHHIIDRQAGGDPRRLQSLACRFGAMVRPGESIEVQVHAQTHEPSKSEAFFSVLNQTGQTAIRHGYACMRP